MFSARITSRNLTKYENLVVSGKDFLVESRNFQHDVYAIYLHIWHRTEAVATIRWKHLPHSIQCQWSSFVGNRCSIEPPPIISIDPQKNGQQKLQGHDQHSDEDTLMSFTKCLRNWWCLSSVNYFPVSLFMLCVYM